MEMQRPTGLAKATSLLPNTAEKRNWSASEKEGLSQVMSRVCALQRQYGKSPAELKTLVEGFAWVLGRYSMDQVISGIARYIEDNPNIPTPSEIKAIIDPPLPIWKPDRSYYIRLIDIRKTEGQYGLDNDEIEYIRKYEAHMQSEMRESVR